jgi:hypothetical protein
LLYWKNFVVPLEAILTITPSLPLAHNSFRTIHAAYTCKTELFYFILYQTNGNFWDFADEFNELQNRAGDL